MDREAATIHNACRWTSSVAFGLITLIFSDTPFGVLLRSLRPGKLVTGDEFAAAQGLLELAQPCLQVVVAILVAIALIRVPDRRRRVGWGLIAIGVLAALSAAIFLTGVETLDGEILGLVFYVLVLGGVPWQIVLAASLLVPPVLLACGWRLIHYRADDAA